MKVTLPTLVIGTVVVVLAAGGAYFLLGQNRESSPIDEQVTAQAQAVQRVKPEQDTPAKPAKPSWEPVSTTEPEAEETPEETASNSYNVPEELEGSDESVLAAIQKLSPALSKWLIPDEQVRKWVLTIDLIADGKLPKRYLPVDYSMAKFAVEKNRTVEILSDKNYPRTTPLIDALTSIDVDTLVDYYHAWEPLLEKAYREQGKPGTFESRLVTALNQILAVTPLEEKSPLIRPSVLYRYASDKLEQSSDVEKFCWRIGEDNTLTLQAFARSLRDQITE